MDVTEFYNERGITLPDNAVLASIMGKPAFDEAASTPQLIEATFMRALLAFETEAGIRLGKHENVMAVLISRDGVLYTGQPGITELTVHTNVGGQWVPLEDYTWSQEYEPHLVRTSLADGQRVRVTYSCDYQPPAGLVMRALELSARLLLTPQDVRGGVTQLSETVGPFTEQVTYAGWAAGGQAALSPEDKRYARRLKPGPWARTIPTREGIR